MSTLMLGIETSCDETAAALVDEDMIVAASVVASQVELHAGYGGVVPEVAARSHLDDIVPVVDRAMIEAGVSQKDVEAIAVANGPGLVGSLLVGVSTAKALALVWNKPIVAVNHLEGHLASAGLGDSEVKFPVLVLLVSGGHTLLAVASEPGTYRLLGSTRDDSVGEAYDKVARLLGLGYPGGPPVDRMAKEGKDDLGFPRPMLDSGGLDFSFAGLKTAVARYLKDNPQYVPEDVAASFAGACMDVLVGKLQQALQQVDVASAAVVGGVAASPVLRERLAHTSAEVGVPIAIPPLDYATDNAAMIAAAAWPQWRRNGPDPLDFSAVPNLKLPTA